jgi:hypothetical protein
MFVIQLTDLFSKYVLVVYCWLYYSDLGRTKPVRDTFILVGQGTLYYFAFFMILIPLVGTIESKLVNYKSN